MKRIKKQKAYRNHYDFPYASLLYNIIVPLTNYYTTAIWVGRDDYKIMPALSGASYPKTIWSNFMNMIHSEYSSSVINNLCIDVLVGTVIGKKAVEAGIESVVFDRGGYIYHGKVKALADAAREAGLKF